MATFQKKADTETTIETRATLIRQTKTAAKSASAITTAATERTTPAAITSVTAVEDYQHPQARPQRQPLQEQREQSATVVLQLAKSRDSQARRTSNFTHSLHDRQQQHPFRHRSRSRSTAVTHRRYSRRLGAPLLRALYSGAKFKFSPANSLFRMITMLVVVTVVISGNAVFAAQRDSHKAKDPQSLSNTANAIPNGISGTGLGIAASNGDSSNGDVSNGNTNSDSASSSNGTTNTDNDSRASLSSSTGSSSSVTTTETTLIITAITTAVATSSGSNSYSLQKSSAGSSNRGGGGGNTIEGLEDVRNGPYFDKAASKNITALLGKTAYLNCRVKNVGNKTMLLQVSWVRHRDIHLLTVGRYTYTSDQRFRAIHQPQTEDWILQIKYPQHRDSGVYECQVSTTPHMSHYIHLNVVEPSTEIIGAPDLYIESGSTINLTCVILNSPEPPAYIFWNHNNAIINYDSPRGGVSVVTNKGETTTSFLLIKSARPSDSGHYQCNPSNAKHKSVTVHVLNGDSHSVSRGVPSSNAARGTGTSANVSGALSVGLSVDLLLQLSVCQAVYAAASSCLVMRSLRRLLDVLLLVALAAVSSRRRHRVEERAKDELQLQEKADQLKCYCHCAMQQVREQQLQHTSDQHGQHTERGRMAGLLPSTTADKKRHNTSFFSATAAAADLAAVVRTNQVDCGSAVSSESGKSSSLVELLLLLNRYRNESDVR